MVKEPVVKTMVIFDLDQTVFDIRHREHLIPNEVNSSTWLEFNAACVDDTPIEAVTDLILMYDEAGYEIVYLSGRGAEVADQTREMLAREGLPVDQLLLRPTGDYTPGPELKKFWVEHLGPQFVMAAYDDDLAIVKMYRGLGITAFQVSAP